MEPAQPAAELTPTDPVLDTDRSHEPDLSVHRAVAEDVPEQREAVMAGSGQRRWPESRHRAGVEREAIEAEAEAEATRRTRGWDWEP